MHLCCSSLGKPRRLSSRFLQQEREKLEQYRESVRSHYAELRAGVREGLPTDLARPLSVGQRVIACHPKMREVHDGSILTVDRNRCRVQFDRPELGVEFVMVRMHIPYNKFFLSSFLVKTSLENTFIFIKFTLIIFGLLLSLLVTPLIQHSINLIG